MNEVTIARALQLPAIKPNFVDRAIATISPRMALGRMEARVKLAAASRFFGPGGYNGARTDRAATKEWRPSNQSADSATIPDLPALRARSRDLERNAPIATGALNTNCTSVVGQGLVPHPRIDRELLGLSEEEADAWQRQAERIWWAWAGTPACDIRRSLNFAALTELTLRSMLSGGDVFGIRRYRPVAGELLGLRVQLLEADRVCNPNFEPDTDRLVGGVEVDEDAAPVRYHVVNGHPGDWGSVSSLEWSTLEAFGQVSGQRQVLHIFKPTRPEQTRGVPYFAPVIEVLKQLDRYSEAELMAAVISAFFTVFIKNDTPEDDGTTGLRDMNATPGATPPVPAATQVQDVRLGPGMVYSLNPGEDISTADPKRPNANFDPFFRAILNQVGVALDIPHELLIKHFTSSYSASRAALLEAWRAFSARRGLLVDQFCQPVYEWVITEAIARGLLTAPGYFDNALVRAAWLETAWTGPSQGQIDPVNEINAAKGAVELGVRSRQEIAAEMFGTDSERTHKQLAKERAARKADGLDSDEVATRQVTEVATGAGPAADRNTNKAAA